MIIGLTGYAGAGKDTVADYLVAKHGFIKMSLADPIKHLLNARFGWSMEDWKDREWKELPQVEHGCQWVQDNPHMAPVPVSMSPRSWAQWLGTEVGRTIAGPSVWVDMLLRQWEDDDQHSRLVIPDVRFVDEAEAVYAEGGHVWRVNRPEWKGSIVAYDQHVSEIEMDRIEESSNLWNDGNKEDLYRQIEATLHVWGLD